MPIGTQRDRYCPCMEGKMHLSGQLSDWSISDLLQIMQVTDKTGSLDIDGNPRGRVHFRKGRVTGAELTGPKGSYVGADRSGVADVLYVLSTMDSGTFAIGAADGPEVKGWSVEEIIAEIDSLRSLEGEVVDTGLFEAAGVRLVQEIDQPVTIEPEDWPALAILVEAFTFGDLEGQLGRGTAVRILHTLHRLRVAEGFGSEAHSEEKEDKGQPEEETDWLDEVVADLSHNERRPAEAGPAIAEPSKVSAEEDVSEPEPVADKDHAPVTGVSAPASTTLTDGVYDEIRRLRSRVSDK
jgi:hypothetical protein